MNEFNDVQKSTMNMRRKIPPQTHQKSKVSDQFGTDLL